MASFILPSFHRVCFGTVSSFVKLPFSRTLEWHIQIVTVMLCISSTEELLGNIKAHFWLTVKTMKNLVEILLTSDLTQHSSSFELASLWTQEPVGTSNVGQDTQSHFLCISSALILTLVLSHLQKVSLQYAVKKGLRRRVMCWMLKYITQEGFLPEKEQNSTVHDTVVGRPGPAASLPPAVPFTPLNGMERRK